MTVTGAMMIYGTCLKADEIKQIAVAMELEEVVQALDKGDTWTAIEAFEAAVLAPVGLLWLFCPHDIARSEEIFFLGTLMLVRGDNGPFSAQDRLTTLPWDEDKVAQVDALFPTLLAHITPSPAPRLLAGWTVPLPTAPGMYSLPDDCICCS